VNTNTRALIALIILAVGPFTVHHQLKPEEETASTAFVTPHVRPQAEYIPTNEEQIWVQDNLTGILYKTAQSYPVDSIRQAVIYGLTKVKSGEVSMTIHARGHIAGDIVTAAGYWEGDQRRLVWLYPGLMKIYLANRDDRNQYEDEVIATFLHELFHLYHQPQYVAGSMSREAMLDRELEAWWWVIEEVVIPMRQHGRYGDKTSETMYVAHQAFVAARGDPTNLAWRSIGNQLFVTAEPKPHLKRRTAPRGHFQRVRFFYFMTSSVSKLAVDTT